jgi:hypothetical protein
MQLAGMCVEYRGRRPDGHAAINSLGAWDGVMRHAPPDPACSHLAFETRDDKGNCTASRVPKPPHTARHGDGQRPDAMQQPRSTEQRQATQHSRLSHHHVDAVLCVDADRGLYQHPTPEVIVASVTACEW